MSDDEVPAPLELFAKAVNGLAGKATEGFLLFYGAEQMVAATTGAGVGGAAEGVVMAGGRRILARRLENLREAYAAAQEESGKTPGELFELALDQDNEQRLDLYVKAFSAAARESDRRKVRAHGRLAATGVLAADVAKVDESIRAARRWQASTPPTSRRCW